MKTKICKCGKVVGKGGNSFHSLCAYCNRDRLNENKPKKYSSIKPKFRDPTGELALFERLHIERGNNCEVCGVYIEGFSHYNYHHIKFKSTYPELRLDPTNILKVCVACHNKFHGI